MLETIISIVITLVAAVVTGCICLLAAHKEEVWEVIYGLYFK